MSPDEVRAMARRFAAGLVLDGASERLNRYLDDGEPELSAGDEEAVRAEMMRIAGRIEADR